MLSSVDVIRPAARDPAAAPRGRRRTPAAGRAARPPRSRHSAETRTATPSGTPLRHGRRVGRARARGILRAGERRAHAPPRLGGRVPRTDDRSEPAVGGLRPAGGGGPAGRRRRLAARRRHGRALRPQPDPRAAGREGDPGGQPGAARLPPDDREPGALGARLRGGRRPQRHGARRGLHRPARRRPRPPRRGLAGRAGPQAGHAARGLPRRAARLRHPAGHDGRARLRRPVVHRRGAAQGAPGPGAGRHRAPDAVRRGRRRHQRRHHRAGRRGRCRRVRRRAPRSTAPTTRRRPSRPCARRPPRPWPG